MDKYALITGSSDRIGKAISTLLAQKGYNLILHYNSSRNKAEQLKNDLEDLGVSIKLIQIDFMKSDDYDHYFQEWKEQGLSLELLVNCASDFVPSGFDDHGVALLDKQININFKGAYILTKAFARIFDKGQIVNFLDTKITKNTTTHLDYLLSKKLLRDFTLLSAVELAPRFRVNAISPGLILPPADKDQSYLDHLAKGIPLKKSGNINDILRAMEFLVDSDFVTGQILYIDGGDHLI